MNVDHRDKISKTRDHFKKVQKLNDPSDGALIDLTMNSSSEGEDYGVKKDVLPETAVSQMFTKDFPVNRDQDDSEPQGSGYRRPGPWRTLRGNGHGTNNYGRLARIPGHGVLST